MVTTQLRICARSELMGRDSEPSMAKLVIPDQCCLDACTMPLIIPVLSSTPTLRFDKWPKQQFTQAKK